jgi:hypothetical protein
MTSPPPNPRHRHRHRHRLLLLQLFVGGVSLATSATAAKSVYTVVEGGSTKDVDACRLGREEVGTAGFECTRITADLDAIRTATEIEFDGSVYMAVEKEIKHKEAAAFSFIVSSTIFHVPQLTPPYTYCFIIESRERRHGHLYRDARQKRLKFRQRKD